MTLDVNGYNATFKSFVVFAAQEMGAGGQKSIARAGEQIGTLGDRTLSITASTTDKVAAFRRSKDDKGVNDVTRDLFYQAVSDMFGGEANIPDSVRSSLLMKDYGKGKPLTARRIMAVKTAIDASGIPRQKAFEQMYGTFQDNAVKNAALGMGFMQKELPKLACATHFYAQAMNLSEMDAMREVANVKSKANRLMNYGGRFLECPENFADGLRLMDEFATWFTDLRSVKDNVSKFSGDFQGLNTASKLNVNRDSIVIDTSKAFEALIFQDIASNSAFDLKETDREKAFGVEHNIVSRFLCQGVPSSTLGTMVALPPDKRRLMCAAFAAFRPLATTVEERKHALSFSDGAVLMSRILRNYDKIQAMYDKGELTSKNLIKTLFPDMKKTGNYDLRALKAWSDEIDQKLELDPHGTNIRLLMEASGATLQEATKLVLSGKTLPPAPGHSSAQFRIDEFDITTQLGRKILHKDLLRFSQWNDAQHHQLIPLEDLAWNFAFPDGDRIKCDSTNADEKSKQILDKLEMLCGRVHPAQTNTVMCLLSQAGLSNIIKGFPQYGIGSDEHSPVNFSLSKDAETGAITIRYSSLEGLPIRFSWETRVETDGSSVTTPMVVEEN